MRFWTFSPSLLSLASIYTVIAQCSYDLSERSVEPARTKLTPYHRVAEAIAGSATASRFVATIAEPTRKDEQRLYLTATSLTRRSNYWNLVVGSILHARVSCEQHYRHQKFSKIFHANSFLKLFD